MWRPLENTSPVYFSSASAKLCAVYVVSQMADASGTSYMSPSPCLSTRFQSSQSTTSSS